MRGVVRTDGRVEVYLGRLVFALGGRGRHGLAACAILAAVVVVVVVVLFGRAVVVQRRDRVFLTERPPPTEARETGEREIRIAFPSQLFDEIQYRHERLFGTPVVRRHGYLATEVQHGDLLVVGESGLFQNHHAVRFAQYVIVERSFRYAVVRGRLREAHFLRHHRLYSFFQLRLRPSRCFHFQKGRGRTI